MYASYKLLLMHPSFKVMIDLVDAQKPQKQQLYHANFQHIRQNILCNIILAHIIKYG